MTNNYLRSPFSLVTMTSNNHNKLAFFLIHKIINIYFFPQINNIKIAFVNAR